MPASPRRLSNINNICAELRALPRPFVDRATVEAHGPCERDRESGA
jgi:hypothetical protein